VQIGACVRYNPRVAPKKHLLSIVIAVFFLGFVYFILFLWRNFATKTKKEKENAARAVNPTKCFL
jgi:hypothetical protein